MKTKLLLVLFLLVGAKLFAQPTISNSASCTSDTLSAAVVGTVPTDIGLYSDDSYSDTQNIGFTFNFYGTNYTQCVIGENGQLSFDLTNALGGDNWTISSALLGNSSCFNTICGPWCDVLGTPFGFTPAPIYTSIQGIAPYRSFAVTWCGVYMYDCTDQFLTSEIIIYETTNIVEVHIGNKTICTSWNPSSPAGAGGRAICGVQNASGTAATAAPGRDWEPVWSASHEGWRFTPDATLATYTASSIPYSPIPYSTATIYWYDSTTGAYIDSGATIVVSPTVTTTYVAAALGCSDTSRRYITLSPVGVPGSTGGADGPAITGNTFTSPSICGYSDGTDVLHGVSPGFIDTIFETFNGIPQPPFTSTAGADSLITITGLPAGTYSFYYKINTCPSNIVTSVLVDPPVTAAFANTIGLGCSGDSVFLVNNSLPAGFTSSWTFGDGSSGTDTDPTHVYHDALTGVGTYNITLIYQTSATDPACTSTALATVSFNHPLSASFTSDQNNVCIGVPITFTNSSVANDPTYLWDFGDGTTDVTANPVHTYANGGVYNVVLTVTDSIPCSKSASENIDVVAIDVHTGVHDTSVCLVDSMMLHAYATVTGSVAGVTYLWTPSNNIGSPNDSVTNFFAVSGDYTYTVTTTTLPLGCSASDTETIHTYAPVTFTGLTANQTIPYGSSVQLNADGATLYTWGPNNGTLDNPNINDPLATPTDSTTVYTVYGMNTFGCLDSANVTITLSYTDPEIIASAFTPNNDGLNDVFRVSNLVNAQLVDFRVFNRWGQQIFQTSNAEVGWDGTFNGTPQDIGTYNYMIIVSHSDGTQRSYSGTVTLIR